MGYPLTLKLPWFMYIFCVNNIDPKCFEIQLGGNVTTSTKILGNNIDINNTEASSSHRTCTLMTIAKLPSINQNYTLLLTATSHQRPKLSHNTGNVSEKYNLKSQRRLFISFYNYWEHKFGSIQINWMTEKQLLLFMISGQLNNYRIGLYIVQT